MEWAKVEGNADGSGGTRNADCCQPQRAGRGRTCGAGCSSTGSRGTACRLRGWLSLASEAEALRGSLTAPILWTLLLREQIKNAPPNELAGRLFE